MASHPVLTHIAIHCRDIEASLAFYKDFCGLGTTHDRADETTGSRVVWLAEPGREQEFIFVLISDGEARAHVESDLSHYGFAMPDRAAVDAMAARAEAAGCLAWPATDEPYPVGYFCGVRDPDGYIIEFSYGQPLGPGAPDAEASA